MPRLWHQTVDAHRRDVRDAIVHATAALVAERGLLAVTMSEIADRTGIGRATLYRYFPDVEAVLLAWHNQQIEAHLAQLADIRDRVSENGRLEAVLEAYAFLSHESRGHGEPDLSSLLHRDEHVERARDHVRSLMSELIAEAAEAGLVRDDVTPEELATYCVHALTAAVGLRSKAAVRRLVAVVLDGLRPADVAEYRDQRGDAPH